LQWTLENEVRGMNSLCCKYDTLVLWLVEGQRIKSEIPRCTLSIMGKCIAISAIVQNFLTKCYYTCSKEKKKRFFGGTGNTCSACLTTSV
jgi:hypothetical protein